VCGENPNVTIWPPIVSIGNKKDKRGHRGGIPENARAGRNAERVCAAIKSSMADAISAACRTSIGNFDAVSMRCFGGAGLVTAAGNCGLIILLL
jgi:hypothetical protein